MFVELKYTETQRKKGHVQLCLQHFLSLCGAVGLYLIEAPDRALTSWIWSQSRMRRRAAGCALLETRTRGLSKHQKHMNASEHIRITCERLTEGCKRGGWSYHKAVGIRSFQRDGWAGCVPVLGTDFQCRIA